MTVLNATAGLPGPPSVPLLRAEEFVERHARGQYELIKGVVKELPMPGFEHGVVCGKISRLIGNHVDERGLGRVVTNDTFMVTRRDPDSVRGMDVGYFSYERLPRDTTPRGLADVPPELVVEVRSPSDTWTGIFAKIVEYLGAGVSVVVVLDSETRTASVYRPNTLQEIFRAEDTLAIADVLPGFSASVASLFG